MVDTYQIALCYIKPEKTVVPLMIVIIRLLRAQMKHSECQFIMNCYLNGVVL